MIDLSLNFIENLRSQMNEEERKTFDSKRKELFIQHDSRGKQKYFEYIIEVAQRHNNIKIIRTFSRYSKPGLGKTSQLIK